MAGLKEFYCRSNETSLGSQFKWLEYTFKCVLSECQGSQAAFCRCYSYDIEEALMKGFIKTSN
jgi:hypothetical protein